MGTNMWGLLSAFKEKIEKPKAGEALPASPLLLSSTTIMYSDDDDPRPHRQRLRPHFLSYTTMSINDEIQCTIPHLCLRPPGSGLRLQIWCTTTMMTTSPFIDDNPPPHRPTYNEISFIFIFDFIYLF
jgi:hypothetical protein